jgi:hypothetical protein
VCAYIRQGIKASNMKELSSISENSFHQLWLKLQSEKLKSLLICVSYIPPDYPLSCFEDHLKPCYTKALVFSKPIIVIGDLNCNTLENGPHSKALFDISVELNLTQIINAPTRITDTS